MTHRVALFAASLALLPVVWCLHLTRRLGEHFAPYRRGVTR